MARKSRDRPPGDPASTARLVVRPAQGQAREVALPRTAVSIGRDSSNDLVLTDKLVSRRHAVIEASGDQYLLRDCESRNGSAVNGEAIKEHVLRDGDLVAIGTTQLLFCAGAGAEAPEAGAEGEPAPEAEARLG